MLVAVLNKCRAGKEDHRWSVSASTAPLQTMWASELYMVWYDRTGNVGGHIAAISADLRKRRNERSGDVTDCRWKKRRERMKTWQNSETEVELTRDMVVSGNSKDKCKSKTIGRAQCSWDVRCDKLKIRC
jgi:hypothetical protein